MPGWFTWRRALGTVLTIIAVAALAGGIALRGGQEGGC